MDHLIENFPHIEVLHLGGIILDFHWFPIGYSMDHLSHIQFENLVKLTLDGFDMGDGKFLVPVCYC